MATVSILNEIESVVLPFCTVIPILVGALGYWIWKRSTDEKMGLRMSVWFMASSAIVFGLAVFHVIFNISGARDPRFGLAACGAMFCVCICIKLHFEMAWVENEDLLLNEHNETADYVMVTSEALAETTSDINNGQKNIRRRRFIAAITYLTIVFQSAFDGLVLKYNPNGNDSGVQVGMFFISKLLESVVISTALIHAVSKTRWYVLYMTNFTITVGLSTLAAYELVPPSVPITIFESWIFQIVLGGSAGILLFLGVYFLYLESRRAEVAQRSGKRNTVLGIAYAASFAASVLTGLFG